MSKLSYASLAEDYERRWNAMVVPEHDRARADAVAREIFANKSRYLEVEKALGVPWYWVGPIHYREADLNWHDHLANGDSLKHRTGHVPRGRIPHKNPPYTWEEGAIDALECRSLQHVKNWTLAQYAYQAEGYNGWGYRSHGITSPYLWSGSNQHLRGKYVRDHVYDPHAVDAQLGVLTVLRSLMALDKEITFTAPKEHVEEVLPSPTVELPPPPASEPATVLMKLRDRVMSLVHRFV